jgi:hypothetical protein
MPEVYESKSLVDEWMPVTAGKKSEPLPEATEFWCKKFKQMTWQ